jgi:AcrR family transcriptional regulator
MRAHLLDAALVTLADSGVVGFTSRRVAEAASTSVPAIYELFGDRAGLVREMFFTGFRRLGDLLTALDETNDPKVDLESIVGTIRSFAHENPILVQVMFSRPFVDFEPGPDDIAAGAAVREAIVDGVRRCIAAGQLVGDPHDIAHVVLATAQGLITQELGGWLGTPASVSRRWALAVDALFGGLSPT